MQLVYNTKDVTTAKAGLEVYKDSYWLCEDGDPKKALFWGKSPQCNRNKGIVERGLNNLPDVPIGAQIVFVETAFVPQRE